MSGLIIEILLRKRSWPKPFFGVTHFYVGEVEINSLNRLRLLGFQNLSLNLIRQHIEQLILTQFCTVGWLVSRKRLRKLLKSTIVIAYLLLLMLVQHNVAHSLLSTFSASLILQLGRDEVEELIYRYMFEVATGAISIRQEPLQHLLVRILSSLVVRVVALSQRFFVQGHQLSCRVLK